MSTIEVIEIEKIPDLSMLDEESSHKRQCLEQQTGYDYCGVHHDNGSTESINSHVGSMDSDAFDVVEESSSTIRNYLDTESYSNVFNVISNRMRLTFNAYMAPEMVISQMYYLFQHCESKEEVNWTLETLVQLGEDRQKVMDYMKWRLPNALL